MSIKTPISRANLEALEAALVRGVTSVMYDGNSVTYRSVSDMMRLRDFMRQELGLSKTRRPRRGVVSL